MIAKLAPRDRNHELNKVEIRLRRISFIKTGGYFHDFVGLLGSKKSFKLAGCSRNDRIIIIVEAGAMSTQIRFAHTTGEEKDLQEQATSKIQSGMHIQLVKRKTCRSKPQA